MCAITVKLNAWNGKFPTPNAGNPTTRADFILRDMQQGLDRIESLTFDGAAKDEEASAKSPDLDYAEI